MISSFSRRRRRDDVQARPGGARPLLCLRHNLGSTFVDEAAVREPLLDSAAGAAPAVSPQQTAASASGTEPLGFGADMMTPLVNYSQQQVWGLEDVPNGGDRIHMSQSRARLHGGKKSRWLLLHAGSPKTEVLYEDRRGMLRQAGLDVPIRDMRDLELGLHESETLARLLARENAIMVCMEHVRAIIGMDKVVVPLTASGTGYLRTGDPSCEIVTRLVDHVSQWRAPGSLGSLKDEVSEADEVTINKADGDLSAALNHGSQVGSEDGASWFELHVLELLLREVWNQLHVDVTQLEITSLKVTDAFLRSPNSSTLEKGRRTKLHHSALTSRVNAVQMAMKRYLEDDADLARLCISVRPAGRGEGPNTLLRQSTSLSRESEAMVPASPAPSMTKGLTEAEADELEDAEGLLELHYTNMCGLERKLAAIGEYIDDAEDYVNLELDFNRNRLIRVEILLTIAMFALGFLNLTAGILGENLVIPPFLTESVAGFYGLNLVVTGVCCIVFAAIVLYLRHCNLL